MLEYCMKNQGKFVACGGRKPLKYMVIFQFVLHKAMCDVVSSKERAVTDIPRANMNKL